MDIFKRRELKKNVREALRLYHIELNPPRRRKSRGSSMNRLGSADSEFNSSRNGVSRGSRKTESNPGTPFNNTRKFPTIDTEKVLADVGNSSGNDELTVDNRTTVNKEIISDATADSPGIMMDVTSMEDDVTVTNTISIGARNKALKDTLNLVPIDEALSVISKLESVDRSIDSADANHNNDKQNGNGSLETSTAVTLSIENSSIQQYEEKKGSVTNDSRDATPNTHSRRSRSSKKVVPIVPDIYDEMKEKIGGAAVLEKLGKEAEKQANLIAKKSKVQRTAVSVAVDLEEACEKLRVLKVLGLLASGKCEVDEKTQNDEPIFLHMFQKAIRMDQLSGNLADGSQVNDSGDRKKLQKILNIFVKNKVSLNAMNGKDGLAVQHIAAKTDNCKLIRWCMDKGADMTLLSKRDGFAPLHYAAKFANIDVMAFLIENGVPFDLPNDQGMTILHIAAMYGQTRIAHFLLRIGAKKSIKDKQGRVAAQVADEL